MKRLLPLIIFALLIPFVSAQSEVKGIVLDSLDNLVGFADIKLDCLEPQVFKTDKFGTFSIKDVPAGSCRVYATFSDGIGFEDLTITNQSLYVEVKLDKTIITLPEKKNYLPVVLIVALIALAFLYFSLYKKEKKVERKEKSEEKQVKELKKGRAEDILKTLSAKEQKIVKLLMANKNTMIQASVRRELGIPRTSLTRLLQGLEAKNIVSTKKLGKTVRIKLTEWFLGK